MRLIRITTNYSVYLDNFYASLPPLTDQPYAEQYRALMDDCFGWSDSWTQALGKLGLEVWEPVGNAEFQQKAWADEHGFAYDQDFWLTDIVSAQVRDFQPDILFVTDYHTYRREFLDYLRAVAPSIRMIIGWCGAPYSDPGVFAAYDLVLSNIQSLVEHFRSHGHRSERFYHAFNPGVLNKIQKHANSLVPFSFVGSLIRAEAFHQERERLLRVLVRHCGLQIWIDGAPPELAARANPGLYGLAMYQLLGDSEVTFNNHIDISARFANNLRLYEATGVGACLLTDWKANLPEIFEPDLEVVTYRNAEEAAEKVDYLLGHESVRREIAEAGQRRTLRDHTFDARARQLEEMIWNLERLISAGTGREKPSPLGSSELPVGRPLFFVDSSLEGRVALGPGLRLPKWDLEQAGSAAPYVWLGQGKKHGLSTVVWSDTARYILLQAQAGAGPGRLDRQRTLLFRISGDAGRQEENRTFEEAATVQVLLQLAPGRNKLDVEVLDTPTTHPPDDSRPLLVQLSKLELLPFDGRQIGPPGRPLISLSAGLCEKALLDPELRTPQWSVEADAERSWLWLGTGREQGLGAQLRASQDADVTFEFDVRPGPARPDRERTLEFTLENETGSAKQSQRISEACQITFTGSLSKGLNTFGLDVLEPATHKLWTDQRPLLLRVDHVRVTESA
jgi:spore maturation protein CgeB